MTMKHDKGLLKAAQLKKFHAWLAASGFETRDGKGDYQLLQVKVSPKLWAVINSSANGVLSTHPELRTLINQFNSGMRPLVMPEKSAGPHVPLEVAPKRDTFIDDLRDDFAMAAMQGFLSGHVAHYGHDHHWAYGQMASEAYDLAEAMLAERAKRLGKGA